LLLQFENEARNLKAESSNKNKAKKASEIAAADTSND
jgi:hypothetical protein